MKKNSQNTLVLNFDKRKEYKEFIEPLVKQIDQLCAIHNIPYAAVFAIFDDGNKTDYIKKNLFPALDIELTNDISGNLMLALMGGKFVVPGTEINNFDAGITDEGDL